MQRHKFLGEAAEAPEITTVVLLSILPSGIYLAVVSTYLTLCYPLDAIYTYT